jgi:hypothetical protein
MSDIVELEYTFNEITRAFENNEISREEYKNLLEGLEIEKAVTMNAEELQRKEQLNTYITAAISAASLLS